MRPPELTPQIVLQTRYRIVQTLGNGGMGCVYRAEDMRLNRDCALKQTFFSNDSLRNAFKTEAMLLAKLRHDSLPIVHDHFADEHGAFLVMEYIPGEDLREMLERRGAFPHNLVFVWANQLLHVLNYLHTRVPSIIHRDVKPSNLKLNSADAIVLLDFGLAKDMAGGTIVHGGSRHFSSLEQRLHSNTDAKSDLYAFGATLYNLVTGKLPPDALDQRRSAIQNGLPDPLKPVRDLNPHVSRSLANVIDRAMGLEYKDRPSTAAELLETLNDEQSTIRNDKRVSVPVQKPSAPRETVPGPIRAVRITTLILLTIFAVLGSFLALVATLFMGTYVLDVPRFVPVRAIAVLMGAFSSVATVLAIESFVFGTRRMRAPIYSIAMVLLFVSGTSISLCSIILPLIQMNELLTWRHLLIWFSSAAVGTLGSIDRDAA
jgi:serine/threonine protein kinase